MEPKIGIIKEIGEDDVAFCTSENIQQSIDFLSREFVTLGLSNLPDNPRNDPFSIKWDPVSFLNNTYELLHIHRNDERLWREHQTRISRMKSDMDAVHSSYFQAKSMLDQTDKKLNAALERERQLLQKVKSFQTDLRMEKKEVKKSLHTLHSKQSAFSHEIKKKECENQQLRTKINQLMVNKIQGSMSLLNPYSNSEGQRKQWNATSTQNSNLEKMYQVILAKNEARCCDLLQDFTSLCKFMKNSEESISFIADDLQDLISEPSGDIKEINPIEKPHVQYSFHTTEFTPYEPVKRSLEKYLEWINAAIKKLKYERKIQVCENLQEATANEVNSDEMMNLRKTEKSDCVQSLEMKIKSLMETNVLYEKEIKSQEESLAQFRKEKEDLNYSKLEFMHSQILQTSVAPSTNHPFALKCVPSLIVVTDNTGDVKFPMKQVSQNSSCLCDSNSNSLPKWALQRTNPASKSNAGDTKPFSPPVEMQFFPDNLMDEDQNLKLDN